MQTIRPTVACRVPLRGGPRLLAAAVLTASLVACGDIGVAQRDGARDGPEAPPVHRSPRPTDHASPPKPASGDGGPARPLLPVLRVVDGDTLHILEGGRDVTIRLIGVDAPEVAWYGGEAECHGGAAGRFLTRLLDGERVHLEYDRDRLDPYGRTLAYVYLEDGRMVNRLLVRRGFATVTIYEPNDRHAENLRRAEVLARSEGAGLWSACGLSGRPGGGR